MDANPALPVDPRLGADRTRAGRARGFDLRALCALAFCLTLLPGCATLFSENEYDVRIESQPSGLDFDVIDEANVIVASGQTPTSLRLKASNGYFDGADYRIEFRDARDRTVSRPLVSRVDGWYWVNFLFPGLLGLLIIDPLSGNMFNLPESMIGQVARAFERMDEEPNIRPARKVEPAAPARDDDDLDDRYGDDLRPPR